MRFDDLAFPAFLGCAGIALLAFARRWWINRKARVKVSSCAACRHPVHDTPSWWCPECGADLRQVGILTLGLRTARPAGFVELATAWTCASVVLGIGLLFLLTELPGLWEVSRKRYHALHSEAGMFDKLSVSSTLKEKDEQRGDLSVTLDVHDATFRCSPLRARFGGENTWKYLDANGKSVKQSKELVMADLQQWLEDGGIACDSQSKQAEVGELFGLVEDVRRDPTSANVVLTHLRDTAKGVSNENNPKMIYQVTLIVVPACLWVVGVIFIHRLTRKRRRQAAHKITATAS